jgi:hypothetical protein
MIVDIEEEQFPFLTLKKLSKTHKIVMAKRRHRLDSSPHSLHLLHKIMTLAHLPLGNLINVRFVEEEEHWVDLYYQNVPMRLREVLGEADADGLRILHRQFIDLAIGLAKVGIVTVFEGDRCGAIVENEETIVKYYLEPQNITITQDLEVIEEAVYQFCAQAMAFLQSEAEEHELGGNPS